MGLFLVALSSLLSFGAAISCQDESGNAVDWFVAVKAPEISGTFPDGLNYYYTDANGNGQLTLSSNDMNSGGAIKNSIGAIYQQTSEQGLLVWNDEVPAGKTCEWCAHSKGVLYFDGSSGMYVVHSAPHFPPSSGGYDFPESASRYGQSFLCMSLGSSSVQKIISALLVTRPEIYMKSASSSLLSQYNDLSGVLGGDYVNVPTGTSTTVSTTGGVSFQFFYKNKYWDSYLYEDLVAPGLNSDLIAETWTNGGISNILPTFCKNSTLDYSVYNAMHVQFGSASWARTKDHSKWAVGVNSDWLCIGGINRQLSQNGRGGGTFCSNQLGLQPQFHSAVIDVNPCGTSQVGDDGSKPPTIAKKVPAPSAPLRQTKMKIVA